MRWSIPGTTVILAALIAFASPTAVNGDPPRNVSFTVTSAAGRPTRSVENVLTIRADEPFQGFEFSVDFDEEVLEATGIVKRWQRPGGSSYDFEVFQMNNGNQTPGNAGVDEGFVAGAAILDSTEPEDILPPDENLEVVAFLFDIGAAAPAGETTLRFEDGAAGHGGAFVNRLVAEGESITPAVADSFVFVNGTIDIGSPGPVFIRGDINSDGAIGISDSYYAVSWLFMGHDEPPCFEGADVNSDGRLDLTDPIQLLVYLLMGGPPPEAPFPDPGIDPNENSLDCKSVGEGQPLEDPVARLGVVDAIAPGGASRNAALTIQLSSSTTSSGATGVITCEEAIFAHREAEIEVLQSPFETGFYHARGAENRLQFGYIIDLTQPFYTPAGEDVEAIRLHFCLKEGTPAGEYHLTFVDGEIADHESGQAIYPILGSGTLTVLEDVADTSCDPRPPPPTEVPRNIEFRIGEGAAGPGQAFGVPFTIRADRPSQGFEFSVDFDEEVLRATDIVKRWNRPGGTSYDFEVFEYNNENRVPGNTGVDEGFLVGAAITSLTDSESVLPPDEDVEVLSFVFTVDENASPGVTELRFEDGAVGSGDPVSNKLIAGGEHITPALADSFVFVDGRVSILPDGALFIRGDSNDDGVVNISDPTFTLNHLFLGESEPPCLDAADANDDGRMDISDPISTLQFLFSGDYVLPPPLLAPGTDETEDDLSCLE